jgi:hypothetical protein
MKRLFLFLLIPLFLLACGSNDEAGGDLTPYESPNYPITFLMPENWVVIDDEDSITIASAESLVLASSVRDGARVNIIVTPSFFTGIANATEVIDTAVRNFREQEGAEVIQEIQSRPINTQSAVETVLRGQDMEGHEIILRYLVIENLSVNHMAVVTAVHDASQNNVYGQLIADIVNSIQMGNTSNQ